MSSTVTAHERSALQSKKFIAYLVFELTGKGILGYEIWHGVSNTVLLATLLILGFVAVTFIGGQAALDKYVRMAEITSRIGKPPEG